MFKKLNDKAKLPTRGTAYSACVDVCSLENVIIGAGYTAMIDTGLAIDGDWLYARFKAHITEESSEAEVMNAEQQFANFIATHYMQLSVRSSLGKKGVMLANGIGVIDMDYKDSIRVLLHNSTKEPFAINEGDRIAQIALLEHKTYLFEILTDTVRDGGFGSTN